ncbi:hypothetical protein [Gorillibacterium sp. sgz5001074]|uniref:hypothetical protein n=1 Tax=Gorillibacterium sp. sgz5001074 TaxID=3446695 RepID=UPI003F66DA73
MFKRTHWEYHVSADRNAMGELGLQGWELVSVTKSDDGRETFYYKRPVPSVSERITLEQRERVLRKGEQA